MEPLKFMYNSERLAELSRLLSFQYKGFDHSKWMKHFGTEQWNQAELKQRVGLIADALHHQLPIPYEQAIDVLIPVSLQMSYGYFGVVFSEFVSRYGRKNWEKSMEAMAAFTTTSTAEFAIRFFIQDDPVKAIKQMMKWSNDKNHHIRRLSSEGSRPRLPWGMKLQLCIDDPMLTFPILDRLKNDPELYVRKSVANHLNDISKDHPEVAIEIARGWQGISEDVDWVLKHGLRGLLKSGDKQALAIMGQSASAYLSTKNLKIENRILRLGDTLRIQVVVSHTGKEPENLRLEYAIDYVKSTGKWGRKVFQWTTKIMEPGEHVFGKSQRLIDFTTRKHYSGEHLVHVIVNGAVQVSESFELHVP